VWVTPAERATASSRLAAITAWGAAIEVDDGGCGLFAVDAVLVAQRDERVSKSRAAVGVSRSVRRRRSGRYRTGRQCRGASLLHTASVARSVSSRPVETPGSAGPGQNDVPVYALFLIGWRSRYRPPGAADRGVVRQGAADRGTCAARGSGRAGSRAARDRHVRAAAAGRAGAGPVLDIPPTGMYAGRA
jgi:hypothetical protein